MSDDKLAALQKALEEFTKETRALREEHQRGIGNILREIHELKLKNLRHRIKSHKTKSQ